MWLHQKHPDYFFLLREGMREMIQQRDRRGKDWPDKIDSQLVPTLLKHLHIFRCNSMAWVQRCPPSHRKGIPFMKLVEEEYCMRKVITNPEKLLHLHKLFSQSFILFIVPHHFWAAAWHLHKTSWNSTVSFSPSICRSLEQSQRVMPN